jgi:hypothetical protein
MRIAAKFEFRLRVNRYSRDLLHDEPLGVGADVLAALAPGSDRHG